MPLRKDWAVLDGLNYVKDHLDGTLSYPLVVPDGHLRQLRHDRQRRAEADLRHLPHRLRARARPSRAADQLPGHPRPRRRHRATSWRSCPGSSRGSSATTSSR